MAFPPEQGAKALILTPGVDGAMYRESAGTRIDLVGICGCGECVDAGVATGPHPGASDVECVMQGQAASAQNATGLGSQAGVRDLEATRRFMAQTKTRAHVAA
ncbi:hypothetical protein [Histidinibacterium lentulum]|uniref:Uncharacterized protein n=1 Tax=Histidinibacterium lentulum TaxID=2480588 RepID=A0A3N2QV57_9RHOB|nr:hypothetical protein [Histidinibacterium lentulum]ROT99037.1 hypothetical protein EAT49_15565 [Histidinibacterium lentulum]